MKKLSREERTGAIVLGVVSLLVICGGMWVRHVSPGSSSPPPEVRIVSVADSVLQNEDDIAGEKGVARRGKKKTASRESRYKRSDRKKEEGLRNTGVVSVEISGQSQWRDFLIDTVPVSSRANQ